MLKNPHTYICVLTIALVMAVPLGTGGHAQTLDTLGEQVCTFVGEVFGISASIGALVGVVLVFFKWQDMISAQQLKGFFFLLFLLVAIPPIVETVTNGAISNLTSGGDAGAC